MTLTRLLVSSFALERAGSEADTLRTRNVSVIATRLARDNPVRFSKLLRATQTMTNVSMKANNALNSMVDPFKSFLICF
jgi:hypothetical protein